MALIICPKCNKEVSLKNSRCPLCNEHIIDCPKCKTQIAFMTNTCHNCGHKRYTDDEKRITINNGVIVMANSLWIAGNKSYFFLKNENEITCDLYVKEPVLLLSNIPIMPDETIPLDYYEKIVLPKLDKLAKEE